MHNIFRYHPEIISHYPYLHAGVILVERMHNIPTPEPLKASFLHEQKAVLESIGSTPLSELVSLAAWRSAFRKFGVDPTQYRSAPEALLRRLTKKGEIPNINALTDIANLVSIRHALPVAVFDLQALKLPVTVRFANGSERYTPLGENVIEHPEVGEVIFADETGLVIARRWCHRQSNDSAATEDTRRALFTIEAMHMGGDTEVHQAVDELLSLVRSYVGGDCETAFLP